MNYTQETTINTTQKTKSLKQRMLGIALAIMFALTLAGTFMGMQTKTTHAATNNTYLVSIIRNVFGPYSDQAIRIAQCESTMNPNARNTMAIGGSYASGLFQILYPSTWNGTAQAGKSPFDPQANAQAAYQLFKGDGFRWTQWQCKA
ncbi:transglycosylase SLT domain-containing protein [Dictyobacter kobayashii]|uniref:Transglycosylase SLT domain-containing protein n=1 Tax=Dictyobacter kobayashii TaxID=2014872 RepID=A0A402AUU4_9CHLR|nr:transglycosylase SLT domain-containing protein [Dictyobacter kobayashii]GCE22864.1 hypothetical protein KDK_66640 [Dictyobacter kobayashii]